MHERSIYFACSLIVSLVVSGCEMNNGCCDNAHYLRGMVADSETGEPVSGATIEFVDYGGPGIVTDDAGRYAVENLHWETMIVMKRGYQTEINQISHLPGGTDVNFNIVLRRGDAADQERPVAPIISVIEGSPRIEWITAQSLPDFAGFAIYVDGAEHTVKYYKKVGFAKAAKEQCFTVSEFDSSGNESFRNGEACATPSSCGEPYATVPAWLNLTSVSPNEIRLAWKSEGSWPHNIYRDGSLVRTLAPGENVSDYDVSFSDTGLSPNTKYCYWVTAVQDAGESQPCHKLCISTWPL